MASARFSEDLTCSICLSLFTDPVTVPCGHSFCRRCVTDALSTKQQCPLCLAAVCTDEANLPSNHTLRSLAEKAKEAERTRTEGGHEAAELCPEHEEKLKLFCITDQQLACIICRDGEKHEGHRFKPVKEAAAALRKELEANAEKLSHDILATESLVNQQREEIKQNNDRSQQLMIQIHTQFDEMHQFLRKRENEIKNELRIKKEDGEKKMSEALKVMETALSESRELEVKAASVLTIPDPESFLKSWTEGHSMKSPEQLFRPRATELHVVTHPLSLGPYESHLQFFVWKQMLQVIQPRAERLTLVSNSSNITVSEDGRSLFSTTPPSQNVQDWDSSRSCLFSALQSSPDSQQWGFGANSGDRPQFRRLTYLASTYQEPGSATSVDGFSSGQHYWEVEVGKRDYWELGLQNNVLKYEGRGSVVCGEKKVQLSSTLQKVGIYIDITSKEVSFYDADAMTLIHTSNTGFCNSGVRAYFCLNYNNNDRNPVAVCWY